MNANRLISMLLNRFLGSALNAAARSREASMAPEERKKAQGLRQNANGARKALRVARRFGRF